MSNMPQDVHAKVEENVHGMLVALGCDVNGDGMKGTPDRVARMWWEMTRGYREDPRKLLGRVFESDEYDQMVTLSGIEFHSTCEHHLLPFSGVATVSYIPSKGRVVGISKLARVVDCFARRFQIQERMTHQIASAIQEQLSPIGVGVVVKAQHLCMVCRGVMKPRATMTTTAVLGTMRDDLACRNEFLAGVD